MMVTVRKGFGMPRKSLDWEKMFRALEAFKKEQGHCHVPTAWEKNPALGRWVAVQRYRHKIGELQTPYVDRLNRIGFVWAPADRVWDELYLRLAKYKGKHGDCDVPSSHPADPRLANWVVNQRHRNKQGSLSDERVRQLTALGFRWSVYRQGQAEMTVEAKRKGDPLPVTEVEVGPEEHLYLVCGEYIQYGGTGPRPVKLEKYIKLHGGELPPCIILPAVPTVFRIGNSETARAFVRKYKWSGKGAIPAEVLEYLNENGVLPPHGEF